MCQFLMAAVKMYHRLDGLDIINVFSQYWRLEVHDQDVNIVCSS